MSKITYAVAGNPAGQPARQCPHLGQIHPVKPSTTAGCQDCLKEGTRWVHLRECLTCGHVGCCDSSPRQHASAHARASTHPLIRSFEPGENWAWCYPDQLLLVPVTAAQ